MSVSIGVVKQGEKCSHGYFGMKTTGYAAYTEAFDSVGDNDCDHSNELSQQINAIYLKYAEMPK
jgi:hypothetical protein